MNSGIKGGGTRVSIPSGVKKTIENIKEITSNNHSEDDIYAMLKECAMDPNETAQKLLLLGTFHEVKPRRYRRKENQNKEPEDQKWKPGTQTRSNRLGRVNYITRYTSQDAGSGSSFGPKENTSSYPHAKVIPTGFQEMKKTASSSDESQTVLLSNGPLDMESQHEKPSFPCRDFHHSGDASYSKNSVSMDSKNSVENDLLQSGNSGESLPFSSPESISNFQDLSPSDVVSASQSEQGIKLATFELLDDYMLGSQPSSNTISPEIATSKLPHEMPNLVDVGETQHSESPPVMSPNLGASAIVKHSMNFNDPSQVIVHQKEWKPKSSHSNSALSEATTETQPTLELERKLKDASFAEKKHVVIPNHLQVPEVKKLGFCFGSFDASFELETNQSVVMGNDRKPSILFESSDNKDEPAKEMKFRSENSMLAAEDAGRQYSDYPQTVVQLPSSATSEQTENKLESVQEIHQHTSVNTPSIYSLGLMPQTVSNQISPLESLESQARDAVQLPGFISFDPASYYAQFYRSGFMDSDGRISPFHPAGAVNKYNGNNNTLIPSQTAQTNQELQGNGQLVFSTAFPTQLVTQAAGVMRSSIPANQQPLPIFRHPSGVHLPHYPPNFIPYAPYFSPFYVPQPAIHQFLSNGTFPQTGSLYPSAPATSSKYSVSQFKQGLNTLNQTNIGLPGNYGTYDHSMASYTSNSSSSTVTLSSTEDADVPHVKESNAYVNPQQNEGSGMWFTTPSGDMQASTFYNIPQGQMPFNPAQPGPGPFTSMFHPGQGLAPAQNIHNLMQQSQPMGSHVDIAGQTANAYQQPHHAQPNSPSNY